MKANSPSEGPVNGMDGLLQKEFAVFYSRLEFQC